MTVDPQDDTVDRLIFDHLDHADLAEAAKDLVIAAVFGDEELSSVLGGADVRRPAPAPSERETAEPIGTYLESIEVTGFRGIGPTATLNLVPGPGLTIVTGRNGSGKSSFAEAAELALTGENKRWSGRTSVWKDGWRNLHATESPRIHVRLGVEGQRNGAAVRCDWAPGAGLDERTVFLQVAGEKRQSVADLGWAQPLELYRPFLSYAELGGLLSGRPSEMHDSLHRILGLGRLVEIETSLKSARRAMDDRRKLAAARLPELRDALARHTDPRARAAEEALAGRVADLDQLGTLATTDEPADATTSVPLRQLDVLDLPDRDDLVRLVERLRGALREIDELAGTSVDEAWALAKLLGDALRHRAGHPGQPCPVCGGRTLDDEWAAEAQARLRGLTERAERLDEAHETESDARRALGGWLAPLPPALGVDLGADGVESADARLAWQHWDDLIGAGDARKIAETALDTFDALVAALLPVKAAARRALDRRHAAWQPLADQLRAWIDTERSSRQAARMLTALKAAVTWLQRVGGQIRNDKLAPVAAEATEIWNTLRQESNVDLGSIQLAGTGNSRRVDLSVNVDGVPGAALGVMSQGELHSLALALFLPRATMPESPFRFLVIDDPVQSMDPAKVYGLARVLDQVARHRQVIVFTHDDRLPAAVRHLQLQARVRIVSRLAQSQVTVAGDAHGDPARRYLDDAMVVARDEEMTDAVRRPVVCNLVRDALEYTCHELIRTRDFKAGRPIAETEQALNDAQGLSPTLALALLSDHRRFKELRDPLEKLHPAAPRVVGFANRGAHGDSYGDLAALVADARAVVGRLSRS
ncbi:AAA domain-containing protein [Asanoa hainanensis]|uniref:Nuclease SbcCD subunit C n=1 Tax=Asanoa hainanensis TaxID=560556 RepID=A0A239H8Q7_9ACTN|nr:AAA family ATPase [Asanoa hainanensis]SNS77193.1 AAA domain-containing protein [Asanoa hainanensis]